MLKYIASILFVLSTIGVLGQTFNARIGNNSLLGNYLQGIGTQSIFVDEADSSILMATGANGSWKELTVRRFSNGLNLIDSTFFSFQVSAFIHTRPHSFRQVNANRSALLVDFYDTANYTKFFLLNNALDTVKSTTIKSDTIWRVYSYDFLVEDSTLTVVSQLNRHLYNDQQLLITQYDTALNLLWQSTIPDWRGQQGGYFPARIMRLHDAYYLAGYCQYPNWIEGFVVKTDLQGNKIWDKRYRNGIGNSGVTAMTISGDTINLVLNDNSSTHWDISLWLAKIDTSGSTINDTIYSTIEFLQTPDIIQTKDGNFVVTGYYDNNFTYNANGVLFKIDRNFNILWQRSYVHKSSYDENRLWRIHQWPDGSLLATGSLEWWDNRPPHVPHDHVWLLSLDSNGCLAANNCGVLSVPEEPWPEKEKAFLIYPNPAHHYIEIRWDWFEMGMEDSFTISISSSTGQVIKQLDVSSWQNNVLIFTLTDLTAGVYLIDISSNEGLGLHNEKLIVY